MKKGGYSRLSAVIAFLLIQGIQMAVFGQTFTAYYVNYSVLLVSDK